MQYNNQFGNITRVVLIDLSSGDFEDDKPFFIRVAGAGNVKYCPALNQDSEAITKPFEVSHIFNDVEQCRKIFASGTTATSIYIGYGV